MNKLLLKTKIKEAMTMTGTDNEIAAAAAVDVMAEKLANSIDLYIQAQIGARMAQLLAGGVLVPTPAGPVNILPGPNVAALTKID